MKVPVLNTLIYCSYKKLFSSYTALSFDGYKILSIITCYFNTYETIWKMETIAYLEKMYIYKVASLRSWMKVIVR
jgi:hypothetical protein